MGSKVEFEFAIESVDDLGAGLTLQHGLHHNF